LARNTNIKLRRSATSGAIPTTANLDLGELAINTYDGKLFLKKNVSGTESIVEIGSSTESQEAVWTEYVYTATASQTTFVGSDDNSNTLSYTPLFLQVFLNGVLLDNGTDYTATSGSSVVLVNAAAAGDLLQVASFVKVIGDGDIVVNSFTGDGSTAAYTLTANPDTEDNTTVFVDGVYQEKDTYTVSGTTLTFDANVSNGASIEVLIGSRNVTLSNIADLSISGDLVVDDGARSLTYDVSAGELNHAGATFHINKSNGVDVAIGNDDFYVDMSTSRVGIGTTNPQKLLHVSDLSGSAQIMISSSDSGVASLQFSDAVGGSVARGYIEYDNSTNHLALGTGALERLRVDSSGNVGIGTTSPSEKLHISSTLTESLVEGTNNSVSALVAGVSVKAPFYRKAGFTIYDENDAEHFFIGRPYAGVNAFDISNRGTSRLRIDSLGLVGIGTTSPTTPLHVYHATTDTVANFQSGDNSVAVNFTALDNSMQIATSGTDGIIKNNGAGSFRLFNNGSERARISNSGNLSVGTTDGQGGIAGSTTEGLALNGQFNFIGATRSGSTPAIFNRITSDGAIVALRRDGSTFATIGVANANNVTIDSTATDHTGLEFGNDILPRRNAAVVDNQTNLGTSSYRFANLYSSNIFASSVGIGTTSPASNLHIKTSVDNSLSQGLVIERSANTDRGYINYNGGAFQFRSTVGDPIVFGETDSEHLRVAPDGNVGIGTNAPNAKLQVEEYGIDTTETSTTATTQVAIHTMAAATFRSARFTVQVTNSTDSTYHLTEILMIHDGTTPSITEYGTIFTGSAEATFDADISSGNVRLLATPASTDSMEFKVICHSITV